MAVRYGHRISQLLTHEADEIILLTIFGGVLLVARHCGAWRGYRTASRVALCRLCVAHGGSWTSLSTPSEMIYRDCRYLFSFVEVNFGLALFRVRFLSDSLENKPLKMYGPPANCKRFKVGEAQSA